MVCAFQLYDVQYACWKVFLLHLEMNGNQRTMPPTTQSNGSFSLMRTNDEHQSCGDVSPEAW